ncbi:hypothetical protein EIM92_21550 [Paenibacillus lentus]|uniref:Uncharacterized protein n=1 Tax=Paenibacillus lentus TaxID=1338368 RepID=A0A3Q8SE33_9BACL|nr:hypothetical protein EIM92_21550 [Paenibacillus lentus]
MAIYGKVRARTRSFPGKRFSAFAVLGMAAQALSSTTVRGSMIQLRQATNTSYTGMNTPNSRKISGREGRTLPKQIVIPEGGRK